MSSIKRTKKEISKMDVDESKVTKSKSYKKLYPTLSDEVSQELAEFIEKAKKYEDKQNNHNFHASKQTLAFNLMVAVEELKQEKLDENFKAFSSYDESYHSCCEIARDIVNGLIEVCGGSTNSTFRDRFRDIYYALKNDKVELITGMSFRKNLVLGKIDPMEFAKMDKTELNSFFEQKRQKLEENYMKEKIVIMEPDIHFIKTSKGEQVVSLAKDSNNEIEANVTENIDCAMLMIILLNCRYKS